MGLPCSPLKSGGFCCNFGCTSRGYIERETSLTSLEKERDVFVGSLCLLLKSGGFCCNFGCTSKGYGERETSLALLERETCFCGLAMLASQKWWFLLQFWVH